MLAAALGGDEHVGRLDVPMDEAVLVGGVERLGDLRERAIGPLRLQRPSSASSASRSVPST